MKVFLLGFVLLSTPCWAIPSKYVDLLPYVLAAPDQGETNTCWFVASTGAMEILLNKKHNIRNPKPNSEYDLAESFLIWQQDYWDGESSYEHFVQEIVLRFNHGEAVHHRHWAFNAYYSDGTDNLEVWTIHPNFVELPRMKVPQLKTELLFARGGKWDTEVLEPEDILLMKEILAIRHSPLIVNYNDDGYWHVVLIVGYDDNRKGDCYEIEKESCNPEGSFYVRDSNGKRIEARAYNWFLTKGNAAAVVELK